MRGGQFTVLGQTVIGGGGGDHEVSSIPRALQRLSFVNVPLRHARALAARLGRCDARQLTLCLVLDQPVKDIAPLVDKLAETVPSLTRLKLVATLEHTASVLASASTVLTDLQSIDLQIRHSFLPIDVANVPSLKATLGAFTNLRALNLKGTLAPTLKADACVPASLTRLTCDLVRLGTTELESIVSHGTNLLELALSPFPISDATMLPILERLTTLQSLTLMWDDRVGGRERCGVWESVSKLSLLTRLILQGLPLPVGMSNIVDLVGLRSLFALNVVDPTELTALSALTNLQTLRVSFIDINQQLPELFSLPMSIRRLHINLVPAKRPSPPSFAAIERLTNLHTLVIQRPKLPHCACTDELFATSLARMSRLEALSLRGFPHVGLLTMSTIAQLERLRWLRIADIDPSMLVALHVSKSLRTMEVPDWKDLPTFVGALTQLRLLCIDGKNDGLPKTNSVSAIKEVLPRCIVVAELEEMPSMSPFEEFLGSSS
jgi:hypothetical protein